MKNPFRLTTPKPDRVVAQFADGFTPHARVVWDSLSAEERIIVIADMASAPEPTMLRGNDGKDRPICRTTMVLVCDQALRLSPAQYAAIGARLKAAFALAREKDESGG